MNPVSPKFLSQCSCGYNQWTFMNKSWFAEGMPSVKFAVANGGGETDTEHPGQVGLNTFKCDGCDSSALDMPKRP